MNLRVEAEALLRVVSDSEKPGWYEDRLPHVAEWLIEHDCQLREEWEDDL